MAKYLLFFVTLSLLLSGCGNHSSIKNEVKAEKLAQRYGDGKYVTRSVTFPLEDSSLAYNTPLPGLGPIAGGVLKLVGDLFTRTRKGALDMSYTLPIPEIPQDLIHSVKLKRFFFYMKPKKRGQKRGAIRDWVDRIFTRYILGQGHTTFAFLDKFALRLETAHIEDPVNYTPVLQNHIDSDDLSSLLKVFKGNYRDRMIDTYSAEDVILLKYSSSRRDEDTSDELYGKIHYLETTKDPAKVKDFFLREDQLRGHYKRILILDQSLIIELVNDPVSEEIFKNIMDQNGDAIEELGVNFIDTCTKSSCLEVNVPEVNLLPIAVKGNAIKLDAILRAGNVPESFKLKGFVEFEVKFDPMI